MVKFEIVDKHDNRTVYEFAVGSYMLGKGDKCDVILNDHHASRNHAKLDVTLRAAVLSDLGSTNGSWVRGARLTAPMTLNVGDVVSFGELRLLVISAPETVLEALGGFDRRPIRSTANLNHESVLRVVEAVLAQEHRLRRVPHPAGDDRRAEQEVRGAVDGGALLHRHLRHQPVDGDRRRRLPALSREAPAVRQGAVRRRAVRPRRAPERHAPGQEAALHLLPLAD